MGVVPMEKKLLKAIEEKKLWLEWNFKTLEKQIQTIEKTIEFLIKVNALKDYFKDLSKDLKKELKKWKARLRRIEKENNKEICYKEMIEFEEDLKEFRKDVERLEMWYTSALGKWFVRNFHNIG